MPIRVPLKRSMILFGWMTVLLAAATNNNGVDAATSTTSSNIYSSPPRFLLEQDEDCVVVHECSLCDAESRAEIRACDSTGRMERWKCEGAQDEEGQDLTMAAGAITVFLNRSCRRTKADDEFLMVRMQVLCVLIGTAAFVAARRQKTVGASLFDQRKSGKSKRGSSNVHTTNDTEIEMAQMEEVVPLTDDDAVDVV